MYQDNDGTQMLLEDKLSLKTLDVYIFYGWCHVKGTAYRVKFINSKCVEIEQNHTSSCSLPIATYESILVFSY